MARIGIDNVSKRFGNMKAADGVDLEIADGEFFTLLGPSGCGKTTTLRLVAGLEFADSGRILIGERDVTRMPPAKRRIAMVFQNYALYPHMTVGENISYPLRLKKVPQAEIAKKVESVAEKLGIGKVLSRKPSEISGGQQQRTAVARAMVQEPMAYLFDEPLSNLDARLRLESRRFLKQVLKDTGGTALYVTHDQTEAMALSDRVGVMKEGKLVQVAPPEDLYARPADTFVAGFVGHLPMNLIEGEIVEDSGRWFVAGGLRVAVPADVKAGGRVTLGVRPEDVEVGRPEGIKSAVADVEPLGSEWIVTLECGGVSVIARVVDTWSAAVGESMGLSLPGSRLHFFDGEGKRIGG